MEVHGFGSVVKKDLGNNEVNLVVSLQGKSQVIDLESLIWGGEAPTGDLELLVKSIHTNLNITAFKVCLKRRVILQLWIMTDCLGEFTVTHHQHLSFFPQLSNYTMP